MLPVTRLVTLLVTSWPVQETPPHTSDTSTRCLFVCFMCNRPIFLCAHHSIRLGFVRDDSLYVRPSLCLCVYGWGCTISCNWLLLHSLSLVACALCGHLGVRVMNFPPSFGSLWRLLWSKPWFVWSLVGWLVGWLGVLTPGSAINPLGPGCPN